jgi:hypothetical protein
MRNVRNSWYGLLFLAVLARAGGGSVKPDVEVCLNPGGDAAAVLRAESMATRIYGEIGINLVWRRESAGVDSSCVVITLAERTPDRERPGALAYALPFEGGSVVVFDDRVRALGWRSLTTTLLAHVFAHEIAHVLQGLDHHSGSGMMKSRWEYSDYKEMEREGLAFTHDDIEMLRRGLELRLARNLRRSARDDVNGGGL